MIRGRCAVDGHRWVERVDGTRLPWQLCARWGCRAMRPDTMLPWEVRSRMSCDVPVQADGWPLGWYVEERRRSPGQYVVRVCAHALPDRGAMVQARTRWGLAVRVGVVLRRVRRTELRQERARARRVES